MDTRGISQPRLSVGVMMTMAALAAAPSFEAAAQDQPESDALVEAEPEADAEAEAEPEVEPEPVSRSAEPMAELAFGLGYRYMHIQTTLDQVFNLHSPTIQLSYFRSANTGWRKYLGFMLTVDVLFPVRGEQQGESLKFSDVYDDRLGIDMVIGVGTQIPIPRDDMSMATGLGVHFNLTSMSDEFYLDWNNLSLGFSSVTTYRWRYSDTFDVGVNFTFGVDFIDPMHEVEPLTWGINTAIVGVTGLHF